MEPENGTQAVNNASIIFKQSQQTHKGECPNVAQNSFEDTCVFFCLSLKALVRVNTALADVS